MTALTAQRQCLSRKTRCMGWPEANVHLSLGRQRPLGKRKRKKGNRWAAVNLSFSFAALTIIKRKPRKPFIKNWFSGIYFYSRQP